MSFLLSFVSQLLTFDVCNAGAWGGWGGGGVATGGVVKGGAEATCA